MNAAKTVRNTPLTTRNYNNEFYIPRDTHVAYNPRLKPKDDDESENFKQFWAIFNQKEEDGAIYLVSDVNHWVPILLMAPEAR